MCSLKNTTAIVAVIAAAATTSIIISTFTTTVDAFSNTQIPSSPLSVSVLETTTSPALFARRGGGGGGSTMGGSGGGRSSGGGGSSSGGNDYDYSGGNLKYGTGKYTQRANDGHNGGVNVSQNGRSMQDSVYREDRENVDRARGRPRDMDMDDISMGRGGPPMGGMEGGNNNDFGSRMGDLEDMERDMGMRQGRGGPRRGDRDEEFMDMEGGGGARDRMGGRGGGGGGGLLRDMHGGGRDDRDGYDEFGSRGGGGMMTNSNGRGKVQLNS